MLAIPIWIVLPVLVLVLLLVLFGAWKLFKALWAAISN
jgi:hypothetical protein